MKNFCHRIDAPTVQHLENICKKQKVKMSLLIRAILQDFVLEYKLNQQKLEDEED